MKCYHIKFVTPVRVVILEENLDRKTAFDRNPNICWFVTPDRFVILEENLDGRTAFDRNRHTYSKRIFI